MNTEEKKKAILDAIDSKAVSARKIDKSGKGTNITRMRKPKGVTPDTVEKIYDTMMALLGEAPKQTEMKGAKKMDANAMIAIAERLEALEKQNIEFSRKIETIEKEYAIKIEEITNATKIITNNIESITKDVTNITNPITKDVTNITNPITKDVTNITKNVTNDITNEITNITLNGLSFSIRLESQGVSGKIYKRFYAKKTIAGKLHRIYLGENFSENQATEKINAYMQKHSIALV